MTDAYLKYLQNKSLGLSPAPEQKKQYKIPIRAIKRMAEERLYAKNKKEYLEEHPICEVIGCNEPSVDLHHGKGRIGKLLYDKRYFKGLCRPHHDKAGIDTVWAFKNKISFSRLNK